MIGWLDMCVASTLGKHQECRFCHIIYAHPAIEDFTLHVQGRPSPFLIDSLKVSTVA